MQKAAKRRKASPMAEKKDGQRGRVTFVVHADPGSDVCVAGTYNSWSPEKKRLKGQDGVYRGALLLPKGDYEYKFVINNVWSVDPENPEWVPHGLGCLNSVLKVG